MDVLSIAGILIFIGFIGIAKTIQSNKDEIRELRHEIDELKSAYE